MPNTPVYTVQANTPTALTVLALPSINNSPEILIYTAGGGTLFPNLPNDLVLEPGLYHGGNPLITDQFQIPSYTNLEITTEKKDVLSRENQKGIMDIYYDPTLPSGQTYDGKIQYFINDVYTTPLGFYTHQGSVSQWNFNLNLEILQFMTNDLNVIPRVNDYLLITCVPSSYSGPTNTFPVRIPYFKGAESFIVQVTDVLILSGTGVNIIYQLILDKSFVFNNGDVFTFTLLNRTNTSIQKELFYKTFEQIEIHRQQLLGDSYNNTTNSAQPIGRMNYLNYSGNDSLGYNTLLGGLINNSKTPIITFDLNDEIKDRISFMTNEYDGQNKPTDVQFEFHLPYVMMNDNLYPVPPGYPLSPVDANGNVLENIFVTNPTMSIDNNIGKYAELYLKYDSQFTKRYGYVFYDLRIVVIDEPELCTALGYNSNRNYTLPDPVFQPGSGNQLTNPGTGISLDIINASNSSPIVITTSTPYNLPRGTVVSVSGVQGNTAANGVWILDTLQSTYDPYRFEIWQTLPTYQNGVRLPNTGIPVQGNGLFINNGIGGSGEVMGALPNYSYFYTYRIRNNRSNSTLPYANNVDFNFTLAGNVDNTQGSLYVTIPPFNWYNQQSSLTSYGLGFEMLEQITDPGYGLDIIVGQYTNDVTNPTVVTGFKNLMCIPLSELIGGFTGDPITGISFNLSKIQDYDRAINFTSTNVKNYKFDLVNNMPLYSYNISALSPTLLSGNGKWTIGNAVYRNHVEINRAYLDIFVPASAWNDTTNPTYTPATNKFITDKYISEVAIIQAPPIDPTEDADLQPMIYAKIAPILKKTQDLDLRIQLSIDY